MKVCYSDVSTVQMFAIQIPIVLNISCIWMFFFKKNRKLYKSRLFPRFYINFLIFVGKYFAMDRFIAYKSCNIPINGLSYSPFCRDIHDRDSVSQTLRDSLFDVIKVYINLVHDYKQIRKFTQNI